MPTVLEIADALKQQRKADEANEQSEYLKGKKKRQKELLSAVAIVKSVLEEIHGQRNFFVSYGRVGDNTDYAGEVASISRCGRRLLLVSMSRRQSEDLHDEQGTLEFAPYYRIRFSGMGGENDTFYADYSLDKDGKEAASSLKHQLARYISEKL